MLVGVALSACVVSEADLQRWQADADTDVDTDADTDTDTDTDTNMPVVYPPCGATDTTHLGNVVCVAAGTFRMGCEIDRDVVLQPCDAPQWGGDSAAPPHGVTLTRSFLMMEAELALGPFKALAGRAPHGTRTFACLDNCPVDQVGAPSTCDLDAGGSCRVAAGLTALRFRCKLRKELPMGSSSCSTVSAFGSSGP